MIFWGLSFIWFKEANLFFGPMTIVFLRLVAASIIMLVILLATKKMCKVKKGDLRFFFLLAFCEPFLYFIGESNGLTLVSATVGSVIVAIIPVFCSIFATIFLKDKLLPRNYLGIAISFLGIVIFIFNNDGDLAYNTKGLLLMLLAVTSAVGYNIILGKLVNNYNPLFIVFVQNVIGCALFLPVFLITESQSLTLDQLNFNSLFAIIELAFFASCGAFVLFSFAVKRLGVARASVFTNCIPIITALFSFVLLDERLAIHSIIGIVVVVIGLLLSQAKSQA